MQWYNDYDKWNWKINLKIEWNDIQLFHDCCWVQWSSQIANAGLYGAWTSNVRRINNNTEIRKFSRKIEFSFREFYSKKTMIDKKITKVGLIFLVILIDLSFVTIFLEVSHYDLIVSFDFSGFGATVFKSQFDSDNFQSLLFSTTLLFFHFSFFVSFFHFLHLFATI